MKRYTVLMFDVRGISCSHRIKERDAKAAWDAYAKKSKVIAVVDGWPRVSGVDESQ